ncbi:M48 family metalloprotease [Natronosporangium hydrolyticum]|uniref:M48 family metalloprotease n=1 Tax=Natronosporangium hydrolyticum TaxID=2811111 RepID=A0A895YDJ9_9ACTN|nr:M48 family metalloprotease [Natronosporangium hydrolyticum]QSB15631.1 M48 family metalloprotease [Natronosporangium hydrolyticum]
MDSDRSTPRPPVPEQRAGFVPPAAHPPVTMAGPAQPTAGSAAPSVGGRPRYFPSVVTWLRVGMGRSRLGILGALFGTWFYVPFAMIMSAVCAVVLGITGFFGGFLFSYGQAPAFVSDLPVLGAAVDAFLPASGGVLGGLVGVLLGLILGFVGGLLLFWVLAFAGDPLSGVGWALGAVVTGLLVGVVYTLYRVGFESLILRRTGARRLSRRERELLLPALQECTHRLGLANHPPILIEDDEEPSAAAYARHIVVTRGLLEEFGYEREVLAGVLCHELVHWRNGDPISAVFIRGVALPLYLVYAGVGWVTERLNHAFAVALLWLIFWPVLLTVRLVVIPAQAADLRRAEYRADQGAVLAGYRDGLRCVLEQLRGSFEVGRNGWTRAVCAVHPPNELRLEKLEDPHGHYPLTAPDPASDPADGAAAESAATPAAGVG